MENLFVPYQIAKELKEKEYQETCLTCYKTDGSILKSDDWSCGFNSGNLTYEWMDCLAPTYQQVIDWLFKEHGIWITIEHTEHTDLPNKDCGFNGYITEHGYCQVSRDTIGIFDSSKDFLDHAFLYAFGLI